MWGADPCTLLGKERPSTVDSAFKNGQNMTLFNDFIFQVYSSKTCLSSLKFNSTAVAAMTPGVIVIQPGYCRSGELWSDSQ